MRQQRIDGYNGNSVFNLFEGTSKHFFIMAVPSQNSTKDSSFSVSLLENGKIQIISYYLMIFMFIFISDYFYMLVFVSNFLVCGSYFASGQGSWDVSNRTQDPKIANHVFYHLCHILGPCLLFRVYVLMDVLYFKFAFP